ncbi:hypothetical protein AVEN_206173-1 [Araneus ventricosus]|uniref:Uncharacterized protein n=1 Tax=Araneus ventricosus TaxID=182803 RepID=A0A4Y2EDY9_ARAVE|nr:hypothetical protein AVEN_206173-1 [Araneus ventricosus]
MNVVSLALDSRECSWKAEEIHRANLSGIQGSTDHIPLSGSKKKRKKRIISLKRISSHRVSYQFFNGQHKRSTGSLHKQSASMIECQPLH